MVIVIVCGVVFGVVLYLLVASIIYIVRPGEIYLFSSLWPVRIVPISKVRIGYQQGFSMVPQPRQFDVDVEFIKRTNRKLGKVCASVDGTLFNILALYGERYSQPQMGRSVQTVSFGNLVIDLPEQEYSGKKLVITIECNLRKGCLAIRKSVRIQ